MAALLSTFRNTESEAEPGSETTPAPVIELAGVGKTYGGVVALRDVDLAIQPGDVTAILGPNGAGKTTLLSLILGLRRPTTGTVRVLGEVPDSFAVRVRVGAMLQETGVPPTLTVGELVELFRSYYPAPRPARDVIEAAALTGLEDRRAARMSGGQQQRLCFALALCGDPELVILDEPTTGLDVESRHRFWDVVMDLANAGTSVLFATHLLEEADALATRVIVLRGGRIVRDGAPAAIKAEAAGETIRLRTNASTAELAGWPGVLHVEARGRHLEILVREAEPIVRRLFAGGYEVAALAVEARNLEDAFLELVKENDR